jgi:uroporphyrinogen decarboxylase
MQVFEFTELHMKSTTVSSRRDNILRAIRFERPEWIPMTFSINNACWHSYDQQALQDLMASHPLLFPDFVRQEKVQPNYKLNQLKDHPYTDPWGCIWSTTEDGIIGAVHGHPLADWSRFDDYKAPDPEFTDGTYPVDWDQVRENVRRARAEGRLVQAGLPHGHTFLRLQDIRGYENLLFDMADEEERLPRLIEMVADFNERFILKWLELEPDVLCFPEDLGMQFGPMLSPPSFRRFIKPVYQRIMAPARAGGSLVHMHSDGDIRLLVDDLIEGGVDAINLQDLVNGVDWIAEKLAGRVCVDLDIDRQRITRFGTPSEIDALIREEVEKIGSKEGGLMMLYGLYPGLPLENVKAVMDAMEKYSAYYS